MSSSFTTSVVASTRYNTWQAETMGAAASSQGNFHEGMVKKIPKRLCVCVCVLIVTFYQDSESMFNCPKSLPFSDPVQTLP